MRFVQAAIVGMLALAAWALFGALSGGGASADSTYAPTTTVKLCNAMPADFVDATFGGNPSCADNLTAGASSDRTYGYTPAAGNLNVNRLVTFSPNAAVAPGAFGSRVGGVRMNANFAFSNGPCNTSLAVDFVLYKIDPASTPSYPLAAGSVNRFNEWRIGSTAMAGDGGIVAGVDASHAGPTSLPLTNIPLYVLDQFPGATPVAAYGGLTQIASTWVPLYMVEFSPGGLASAPGAYSLMNANMGAPLALVFGDPSVAGKLNGFPGSSLNICDTNLTTTLLGLTNPPTGTQLFLQYAASQRDLDQDGFENVIDTCPYNAAPTENPRNAAGVNDSDSDGIMNSCDTNTPLASGTDVDSDGYLNRYDNCPQVANSTQVESEPAVPPDLGPTLDGLGDACDGAQGGNPSGSGTLTITQNGSSTFITLSDTVSNGRYMTRTNVVPKCFSGTDADGDGYCTAGGVTTDNADSGACASTPPPPSPYSNPWVANACFFRHLQWNGTAHPGFQMDSDGDSVAPGGGGTITFLTDAVETYLGTDPTKPCAATHAPLNANNEGPFDNWALDMDDNGVVNVSDYNKYGTILGAAAGGNRAVNQGGNGDGGPTTVATINPPLMPVNTLQTRFDVNMDGFLNTADLGKFNQYMTKSCGSAGAPPQTVNNSGTVQQ